MHVGYAWKFPVGKCETSEIKLPYFYFNSIFVLCISRVVSRTRSTF